MNTNPCEFRETIEWFPGDRPPDPDLSFVCKLTDGEIGTGYFDGECWRHEFTEREIDVLRWCDPTGDPPK